LTPLDNKNITIFHERFDGKRYPWGHPSNDKSVNINAPVALPTTKTASLTFNLQQAIQQTNSSSTGTSSITFTYGLM
jgi:hypothetical protein